MGKTQSLQYCDLEGCKKPRKARERFCHIHYRKATINKFLSHLYSQMNKRVKGKSTKRPDLYKGLPILPRDVFVSWAKNHPDFLKLYKRWFSNDFNRKLTPAVNRMNPQKGYTLDNMEWMTNSQNCGLSGQVIKMNRQKAIYDLLGVNK